MTQILPPLSLPTISGPTNPNIGPPGPQGPAGLQGPQGDPGPENPLAMTGDVTGTTDANTLSNLQGFPLHVGSSVRSGEVIVWNDNDGQFQPIELSGDVQWPVPEPVQIVSLQFRTLDLNTVVDGGVLTWSQTNSNLTLQLPFEKEYVYANVTTPVSNPTSGTQIPLALVSSNEVIYITGNITTFVLHFLPGTGPNVGFKLTANIGIADGEITYQWWDTTNNVGLGNVALGGNGAPASDAVAIVPYNYANGVNIVMALQVTGVNGTTTIGTTIFEQFLGPWAVIETFGIPQDVGS